MKTSRTSQQEELKRWVREMLRVYRGGSTSTRRAGLRARLRNSTRVNEADHMPGDARDDLPHPSQRHGNLFMAVIIIAWLLVVILYIASVPKSP